MNNVFKNILPAIILLFLASSCGSKSDGNDKAGAHNHDAETKEKQDAVTGVELTDNQYNTVGVVLGAVEQKQLSGTVKASGLLDVPPQNLVSISVPFGGFLKSTNLLQGSFVNKGQQIAVIENPEYIQIQQDYLESKSHLEFLESEYKRQEELMTANVNAKKTFQKAKADFMAMKARVQGLRSKLQLLNISPASIENGNLKNSIAIYSPINGYVTQVNVNIGSFANPTDVLFRIVDTEHLHAELTIFEKDIPKLKIGQRVRFNLSNDNQERTAKVHLIGREISKERTINVHCHLDKEETTLIPGTFLSAVVETGLNAVSALPDEAVVLNGDKKIIFLSEGTKKEGNEIKHVFIPLEVQTGVSEKGFTEVLLPGGFESKKGNIVIKGAYDLLAKMNSGEEEGHAH
ncbi:efflux RND transporter periplasmic adaptor subunit [Solitalea lacus]|uniref:efflux RND transporter periplasmic adaptor subunit n=1 Tax=Solitalea lacus TaxID=2911172 RepID=UPI001EDA9C6A|nr:efflux RND transporter periplasmic adaptor subunit [Solitalea lacus]UKJ08758.1 efflux RND transporter periplasmic adaptor subunit [Solitalea lacus]